MENIVTISSDIKEPTLHDKVTDVSHTINMSSANGNYTPAADDFLLHVTCEKTIMLSSASHLICVITSDGA